MNTKPNTKPAVLIYESDACKMALTEICAGLEEESVPYAIYSGCTVSLDEYDQQQSQNVMHCKSKTLAYAAANHSRVHIGIGITPSAAAMQIKNCHIDKPVLYIILQEQESQKLSNQDIYKQSLRRLGTNAARAVKGSVFI